MSAIHVLQVPRGPDPGGNRDHLRKEGTDTFSVDGPGRRNKCVCPLLPLLHPERETDGTPPDLFSSTGREVSAQSDWVFPAASVTAVELVVEE